MAKFIDLEHPITGELKTGFYGFSWTTLLFGPFPALFRQDCRTFLGAAIGFYIILPLTKILWFWPSAQFYSNLDIFDISQFINDQNISLIIRMLIYQALWAFLYNKYYTIKCIKNGFRMIGNSSQIELAAASLNLKINTNNSNIIEPSIPKEVKSSI